MPNSLQTTQGKYNPAKEKKAIKKKDDKFEHSFIIKANKCKQEDHEEKIKTPPIFHNNMKWVNPRIAKSINESRLKEKKKQKTYIRKY